MTNMKEFISSNKEENELESTTVVIDKSILANKKSDKPQIVSPTVFSQVEDIANEILKGKSIIVDLSMTDIAEAKRICDFLNGVTFAIDGRVEKVARLVYLFTNK